MRRQKHRATNSQKSCSQSTTNVWNIISITIPQRPGYLFMCRHWTLLFSWIFSIYFSLFFISFLSLLFLFLTLAHISSDKRTSIRERLSLGNDSRSLHFSLLLLFSLYLMIIVLNISKNMCGLSIASTHTNTRPLARFLGCCLSRCPLVLDVLAHYLYLILSFCTSLSFYLTVLPVIFLDFPSWSSWYLLPCPICMYTIESHIVCAPQIPLHVSFHLL
jgi:hypothetical protein